MFRKISVSVLVAVVVLLSFAVAVSAQGRWDGTGPNNGVGMMGMRASHQHSGNISVASPMMNRTGDGPCVNFVDENNDGICDNAGTQMGSGSMNGRGMNRGMGSGSGMGVGADGEPLHQFGDGTCDYGTPLRDGTGPQTGQ